MKWEVIQALGMGMILSGLMVGMLLGNWATVALIAGGLIALALAVFIDEEQKKRPGARP